MPLQNEYREILNKNLETNYVPYLSPLLDPKDRNRELDIALAETPENKKKNISRAFGAFVIHNICDIPIEEAIQSVTDDYDDFGIDALYYHSPSSTVYIVQTKFKASEAFKESDALSFCEGIRKLVNLNLDGFNKNFQDRAVEIEGALDECNFIQIIIAHIGSGMTEQANHAIQRTLDDLISLGEERLRLAYLNYDADRTIQDMLTQQAPVRIDDQLHLLNYTKVEEPRLTAFGLVSISELIALYNQHNNGLFQRNIRFFLGHQTEVNQAIQQSLLNTPRDFLYLNNGITILCESFLPKVNRQGKKRIELKGFSVINGTQTITAAASFVQQNPDCDITDALVSVTLIQADLADDFGNQVTHARNHQNQVKRADFVALDPEQERLRREIAYLGVRYVYKADQTLNPSISGIISVSEAAFALAAMDDDPRIAVTAHRAPGTLLDVESVEYKRIFDTSLTAFKLINAVHVYRYIKSKLASSESGTTGNERAIYKNGVDVFVWILIKQLKHVITSPSLLDETHLEPALGAIIDELRQLLADETLSFVPISGKGPRAIFNNQTDTIPIMEKIMLKTYGLTEDRAISHVRSKQTPNKWGPHDTQDPYPIALFDYMIEKAPQIGL